MKEFLKDLKEFAAEEFNRILTIAIAAALVCGGAAGYIFLFTPK